LKMRWTNYSLFAAAMAVLSVAAIAGQGKPVAKVVKGGEHSLVGINLYDSGTRVISIYGNPSEIQAVSFGGGSIGPSGGGGAPVGGGRGGGGPMAPGGGKGGGGAVGAGDAFHGDEFGFGNDVYFQKGGSGAPDVSGPPGGQGGFGPPPGAVPPGAGRPGGGPVGPSGAGGGGTPSMGGGSGEKILYTRWVYRRGPSKYGFILDKYNRVVQVEAIGLNDPKVRTSKGIKFGSTFADVMNKYQTPDGYEINGDSIVLRYLVRNKVAFRLSRLAEKKPHVVTGVVVAGGKT
jgi:hypothetical protein